jgi:hypothetical protein
MTSCKKWKRDLPDGRKIMATEKRDQFYSDFDGTCLPQSLLLNPSLDEWELEK